MPENPLHTFRFEPVELPAGASALRREVREVIAQHAPTNKPLLRANSWAVPDRAFSEALGAANFIGMTWPKRYGGHERSALERYIVLEELLAAGAPVGAHWIADRQTGPLLLRYGSEAQRQTYLPLIAQGRLYACIGMSEPDAGSDLANVRTSGFRDGDGWVISGQKVWTTNAHNAAIMTAVVRTEPGSVRNAGLSQFLIPLDAPGVTVRPIIDLAGGHDFNEVFLDEVRVSTASLIGTEGQGWSQVTAELSLERSGPERYLSSYALLVELLRYAQTHQAEGLQRLVGRFAAELWTLRQMSLSVAGKLSRGEDPALEAVVVKDLGNSFEQEMPRLVQAAVDLDLNAAAPLVELLGLLLQISPSFSLRGGTREILRGIIARGLGLR